MRSISETTKILHALYQNEDDVLQPCLKKMKLKKRELTKDDAKVKKHKEMVPSDGEELADHADVTLYDDNITWCESRPCEDEIMGTEITKSENKVTERKVTKDNDKVLKIGVINDEDEIGGVREFPSPSIFAQSFQTIGTPRSEEICDNPVDTCNPKDSEKSNAYLNEKETWKVKSRDKKKHGKFLRPCPDIRHRHKRPKSISSIVPLLKNGLLLGPVKLRNKNIMVRNTCPFDYISQSMLVAYCDWARYQEYISSTKNRFFDFIKLFDKSGCTLKVYKERAELTSQIKEIDHGVLGCMMNVNNLMKHLSKDEPSYMVDYHSSFTRSTA
ncbi:uncharacterized protein [Venturia canescens]|uniref:uncharacterized protein isoform X2 n=1 Tax=Venturia canescens TaxID=32260 RepID=UPI001C9C4F77|nr:uncharacterized protein LOC122410621 isoform X2 [Venturia canescens]